MLIEKLKQELKEKNRELAIEASLERVRGVAMAMKIPEDMLDVCRVISKELESLGIKEIRNIQTAIVNEEKAIYLNYEYFRLVNKTFVTSIAYKGHPDTNRFVRKMLRDPEGFFTKSFKGREQVREWIRYQTQSGQFVDPDSRKANSLNYYFYSIGAGALGISTYSPINKDQVNLFKRFRNVFQLSFQRFMDIQKAEAQARDAQIEAALERVRGKALAMHKSEELHGVVTTLKKELVGLKIPSVIAATIYLKQDNGSIRVVDLTTGGSEDDGNHLKLDKIFRLETTDPNLWVRRMFKEKDKYFVHEADEKDFRRVIKWLRSVDPGEAELAKKIIRENKIKKAWLPTVRLEKGRMNIDLLQPPTPEIEQIMLKLGAGFDLAYRRFLDLQKAEAQARDAQIELGLERVRARAMAMHKSQEVLEVAGTLFEALQKLGFTYGASSIIIMDKYSGDAEYWIAGFSKNKFPESYPVKYFRHPYHDAVLSAWKKGEKNLVYNLKGAEKKAYDKVLFSETGYRNIPDVEKKLMRGISSVTFSIAFMKHGALHWGPSPLTQDQGNVLQRFAQVFEQAYTRFLDLQKAEAQAREARIEAALEKVRARAMAMQTSDELQELIATVYSELTKLDLILDRCFINIFDPETIGCTWWMAAPETNTGVRGLFIQYHDAPPYLAHVKAWKERQVKWVYVLDGDTKKKWDNFLFNETELSLLPKEVIKNMKAQNKVFLNSSFNAFGYLNLATLQPLTDEQFDIMVRFARVFDLTYTRFNDLKQAEAQAKEANIEAALEKVRSRSLAMHTADELGEVITVIVEKLRELDFSVKDGVALITYIEGSKDMLQWMENPGFRSATKFYLPYFDHPILRHLWKAKDQGWEFAAKTWTVEENRTFLEHIFEYSDYKHTPQPVKDYGLAASSYSNYIAFQKNTSIFINDYSEKPLSEQEIDILIRFSRVFEQAYIRFMDLQKAEAQAKQARLDLIEIQRAKKNAEDALLELKTTQVQLIQSEKMASLGEMTAGIAHEIQNPLNFVNNFSEVSSELISEMKEQLEKGNSEGAIELVEDVKQNLEKINLHGKRADSIVKSMLQHSRSSAGQKEPTDINALVDEYLRLAFHGFRAKDQTFNAKFETRLDNTLEKINVVPQEIGRVILNLVNNAFYAVTAKRKENIPGYEPMVKVSTLNNKGAIEVRVHDNGNGMPSHVIDKIFQPFFTTKPTGQGTGLGLSLSYDIITKGHAGELKVNTKEGEGSEFIIQLPVGV